ncbi:MAG: hypothetical protein GWN01_05060 [Nitrosopumilaceae archaeon]|nr:hypothetical protein [Nitrosopumilaceae archaeon]NIU00313.1 hypothetical protein [Nitrosopumilaceae archaeon]NIU86715.1 hypothetical protein [Nitrosopumilaceae archaeon]NIV65416.1 hypothetical protein [Nitrosopumilaceae archaeon]NIX60915.1 hypothetical protein [Nitrosopumilaceae archaeon]
MPVHANFDFWPNTRPPKPKKLMRISDGDTPVIEQPIRLVSCDTPEKSRYAGGPNTAQTKLDACKNRLEDGTYDAIPQGMREYLIEKLTNDAAQKHIAAGYDATAEFDKMLDLRLDRGDGTRRDVAVIPTGEIIETFGRMLAYIAPWFDTRREELPDRDDPERRTFNLQLVETGWAAMFPIYPSLPRDDDFDKLIKAAEIAWNDQKGAWKKYGRDLLLAYEYRACVKLGTADNATDGIEDAFKRYCVNLETLEIFDPVEFHQVPVPYRMWIWKDDLNKAKQDLGLH